MIVAVQIVAMLTMLIDHIGLVYFSDNPIWRIVGRLAFPIYAYYIVLGYRQTRSVKSYMNRLLIIAAISQIPYMIALDRVAVNAVGTLYMCLAVLYFAERKKPLVSIPAILAAAAIMELLRFDYGAYGLALVLIYHYLRNYQVVMAHLALTVMVILIKEGWEIQIFSIFATLGIVYGPKTYDSFERRNVPKWLWRSFYPAHLALIALFNLVK